MKQEEFDALAKAIEQEDIAMRLDLIGGIATELTVGVAFGRIKDAARELIDAPAPKRLATTPETVAALKELLQLNASRGVVVVDFIKTDGTPRTMHCTLNSETNPMLAEDRRIAAEKDRKPRAENPDLLAVWDIEKNGWRSFRIDSVTGYKTIN